MSTTTPAPATLRFRHSAAGTVAAAIVLISLIPLVSAGWYLSPLLLIPLAIAAWTWRAGTDVDESGLLLHATLGDRRVAWAEIVELTPGPGGRVMARLTSGAMITLPAVTPKDLPRLVASTDQAQ